MLKTINIVITRRFNGTDLYHILYYVLLYIGQLRETFLHCVGAYCMNLHTLSQILYAIFFAGGKISSYSTCIKLTVFFYLLQSPQFWNLKAGFISLNLSQLSGCYQA